MVNLSILKEISGTWNVYEMIDGQKGRILFSSGSFKNCEKFKQMAINEIQDCYDLDFLLFGIDDDMILETVSYFERMVDEEIPDDPELNAFKEKQQLNTDYGKMAQLWNSDLARKLADRAIQQTVDSDELRARVGDLIDPEIVDMACTIIDDFFMKQSDETEDFLDFLMSDKSIWEAFPGQAVES